MEQQPSLFGLEDLPCQINDLFVAFLPDEPAIQRIVEFKERFKRQHGSLGKPVPSERSHMTLVFVGGCRGDIPQSVIKSAFEACQLAAQVPSFPIGLDHVETFGGRPDRRPLVLSVTDNPTLMEFQRNLMTRLIHCGLACKENPKFNPHLTLSRGSKEILKQPIEPICWTADEIVLVQSVIGEGKYIHLGRWPLLRSNDDIA